MGSCNATVLLYIFATIFVTVSFALTNAAVWVCNFLQVETSGETFWFGIYQIEDTYGSCVFPLPTDPNFANDWATSTLWWTDSNMMTARALGGLASLLSLITWISLWSGLCCGCYKIRCFRIAYGIVSVVCAICSGFLFMSLGNSATCGDYLNVCSFLPNQWQCRNNITVQVYSCKMDAGGVLNIIGMVFFVLAGVMLCITPNPKEESSAEPSAGVLQSAPATSVAGNEVTIEKTEHADGTVVTKTTTVNPDGSKTIEETTEHPEPEIAITDAVPVTPVAEPEIAVTVN
mmetsp:Transcript_266/g.395  ORF Transcript_266/g.395 Transcript_266/m.395 type:complete len:289 (+) Transcript_266:70-936(+)